MNLSSLQTFTSLFVSDPNQTLFTPTQYTNALNEAQRQFALESKALFKDASTYTVVDGTAAYSLPTDFMWEKEVTHKGLRLQPISRSTLLGLKGNDWSVDTGTPTNFIVDPEEARKQLLLYPIPTGGDAGANLILTYYPLPVDLSASTDVPLNSSALLVQFHMGIVSYAAWLLLGYEPATAEIMAKRREFLRHYNDMLIKATDTFKNTASEPIRMLGGRYW